LHQKQIYFNINCCAPGCEARGCRDLAGLKVGTRRPRENHLLIGFNDLLIKIHNNLNNRRMFIFASLD